MTTIQRSQAIAGRAWWSGIASTLGSQRSTRRPIEGPSRLVETVLATSAHDVGPIADARLRDDDPWRRRIAFDLAAKVRDVDTKVLLWAAELPTPHRVENLLMRESSAAGIDERAQNLPLDRSEMDLPAVALDATRDRIDAESLNGLVT